MTEGNRIEQERKPKKIWDDRTAPEYILSLNGLEETLNYIKKLDFGGIVLDVGAGKAVGIKQIKESYMGSGLTFLAVEPRPIKECSSSLGEENTLRTCAEELTGIKEGSVAGIIAVDSIPYSNNLDVIAKTFDKVLIPGGVIKANFKPENRTDFEGMNTHHAFTQRLKELGYDVCVLLKDENIIDSYLLDVVIAVKPGGGCKYFCRRVGKKRFEIKKRNY